MKKTRISDGVKCSCPSVKNMRRNIFTVLVLTVLCLAITVPVGAENVASVEISGTTTPYSTFVAAITYVNSATEAGDYTIKLLADSSEDITIDQQAGKNIVVTSEEGVEYSGTITVDGNSHSTGTETLTIVKMTFNGSSYSEYHDAIEQNSAAEAVRYPHNILIKECTFIDDENFLTAVRFRQGYNISIENCTQIGGYQLLWTTSGSVDSNSIKNTIVRDVIEGINLGTGKSFIIDNVSITSRDFGIRIDADGNAATTQEIKNSRITSPKGIILRKTAATQHTLNIENTYLISQEPLSFTEFNGGNLVTITTKNSYWGGSKVRESILAEKIPGENVHEDCHTYNIVDTDVTCDNPQKCLICGEVTMEKDHSPGSAATCTTPQTCTVCDGELSPALGHTPGAEATETTPQCCIICSEILVPAKGVSSSGSSVDTGSGKYISYPRTTSNGGTVDFGTSPVITEVILPEESSGKVVLTVDSVEDWPSEEKTSYGFDISVDTLGEGIAYIITEIKLSDLERLEVQPEDIGMYHFINEEWVPLKITYEVKDDIVLYTAETDSFSPFEIRFVENGASAKAEEVIPEMPNDEPVEEPTYTEKVPDLPDTPTEVPSTPAPILGVIVGIFSTVAILRRK